jgi:5'-nucleotidase
MQGMFARGPYFNFFKGEVEYKVMSAIGYDASTLGNHEFDNGVDSLALLSNLQISISCLRTMT